MLLLVCSLTAQGLGREAQTNNLIGIARPPGVIRLAPLCVYNYE